MKLFRKITALLLMLLMVISAVSCAGNSASDGKSTTADAADTTADPTADMTEIEKRQLVSDGIPDGLDFGGETFTMLVQDIHILDAWVEEMTGDIVEDAVYERNSYIEDRFNVDIVEATQGDYGVCANYLKNAVNSGDDVYDLFLGHAVQSGADAVNGYFVNWYDINYTNFEQPWYPQRSIKNLTIDGKMFLSVSDLAISVTKNTYCMFFDKVVGESYQLPNMYEIVNNGTWTIDKLMSLTKDVYVDENGDGAADKSDYFGFASNTRSNANTYLWAFDQPVVEITPELEVNITYNSQKTVDIIAKIRELFYGQPGSMVFMEHGDGTEFYRTGHVLFVNGLIGDSITHFRDVENDFGIIPYPKWNEEQAGYYTMSDGNFSIIAVPTPAQKLDMIGAVTHAMGAYSWKNVLPVYYDVALKVKGARDEESVAILDMILAGRVIDFAYLYDGWQGYVFTFEQFTYKDNKTEFASMYASKEKAAAKYYQKVLDLFLQYGQQ